MHDYLMGEDSGLWDIVLDEIFILTSEVKNGEKTRVFPKTRQQYSEADRNKIDKATRLRSCWFVV